MTQQGTKPPGGAEDPLDRTIIVAVPAFLIRYGAQQGLELDALLKAAK